MSQSGFIVEENMIYIAGPLFNKAEQNFNLEVEQAILRGRPEAKIFLPQREVIYRDGDTAETIASRCLAGLVRSLTVVAVLDGPQVDSGTAFELGYAISLQKKVIGLRTDFRNNGDVTGFGLNAMFSLIPQFVHSLKELEDAINQL